MVVVLVLVAGPPHGVLGVLIHDDELIPVSYTHLDVYKRQSA